MDEHQNGQMCKNEVLKNQPTSHVSSIPHEGWVCIIDGKWIINHLMTTLRKHLNGTPILNHWLLRQ